VIKPDRPLELSSQYDVSDFSRILFGKGCFSFPIDDAEIRRKKPELVFLDVQMPECDGFDVLEQLGSEIARRFN